MLPVVENPSAGAACPPWCVEVLLESTCDALDAGSCALPALSGIADGKRPCAPTPSVEPPVEAVCPCPSEAELPESSRVSPASRSRISLRVRRLRRISAVGVRSSSGDAPSRIGARRPFALISRRDILGCSSLIHIPSRCPGRRLSRRQRLRDVVQGFQFIRLTRIFRLYIGVSPKASPGLPHVSPPCRADIWQCTEPRRRGLDTTAERQKPRARGNPWKKSPWPGPPSA